MCVWGRGGKGAEPRGRGKRLPEGSCLPPPKARCQAGRQVRAGMAQEVPLQSLSLSLSPNPLQPVPKMGKGVGMGFWNGTILVSNFILILYESEFIKFINRFRIDSSYPIQSIYRMSKMHA